MQLLPLPDGDPLSDLSSEQPPALRLQRLVAWLRTRFACGAVVLLRLQEEHLRPVALDGLVGEALGRRFAVAQHPRLATILARSGAVRLASPTRSNWSRHQS